MIGRLALLAIVGAVITGSAHADAIWPTTGFGIHGFANVEAADAVAVLKDGTIVTARSTTTRVWLYRYSAGGRSIGFGELRRPLILATGSDCRPALAVRSNGTILVACGDIVAGLGPRDGDLRSLTTVPGANFDALAIDSLGRILAAGSAIVRIHTDGTLDDSFTRTPFYPPATAVVTDGGRIVTLNAGSIRAFLGDGSADISFGDSGAASFPGFTATSLGISPFGIVAGGSLDGTAAAVRFLPDGTVDESFGALGIVTWGPGLSKVAALTVGAGGAVDAFVDTTSAYDGYDDQTDEWSVQRITSSGTLGDEGFQPSDYSESYSPCQDHLALAIAAQPDGKTLVSGTACGGLLLARYDRRLQPDVGLALHAYVKNVQIHGRDLSVEVGLNGPCRLIARIQRLDGNDLVGAWLGKTVADPSKGPATIHLSLTGNELSPHGRYAVVVSAYDARGYFTTVRALLR